ncbi:DUF4936 family protein [Aquabacterium sp. A3]|uniref:DUF4936 family protein n=1 Tax=Aquabacterium sp. A3 TaxID=3132829 RepID=UPI00311A77D7
MPECNDLSALFVYYRLPPSSVPDWPVRVAAVHRRLCGQWQGLHCRLMQRRDESRADGSSTWMEVFEHPAGLHAELQQSVIDALEELDDWRSGELHVERFTDVATDIST